MRETIGDRFLFHKRTRMISFGSSLHRKGVREIVTRSPSRKDAKVMCLKDTK